MNYDIAALKRKMLVKYPFFGSVVANVDYKEDNNISTAATDGKTIYYNPKFLEELTVEQQTFAFAHEVCHIAFNHILRSEGKNPELWNTATDGVINQFLMRDGLEKIEGIVDIPEAINYDAEQLYEKLLREKEQQQKGQGGETGEDSQKEEQQQDEQKNGQQQSGDSQEEKEQQQQKGQGGRTGEDSQKEEQQDVGHDTHSMWEDAIKKHKEEQQQKKDQKEEKIEEKQQEMQDMGEKNAFQKNSEVKKGLLDELKKSISQQASQAGNTNDRNIRTIEDIGNSKPIVDWRYVLRESINHDVDWSYKNATIEDGIISANLEEKPLPETEIVLDTSGSIDANLLRNFLRECKNILQHTKLKVGCFDTEFYGFHEIRTEEDIDNMQFIGGGGTDFNVAVGAFSRRVENKIVFTDGDASMPDMSINAIWIVFGGSEIHPKGGRVINITKEQYDRLQNLDVNYERNSKSL